MAAQFVESVSESSNSLYYVFTARSLPFDDDNTPPTPQNDVMNIHYNLFDEMIFGKKVNTQDVKHMIRRVNWVSGTVYDRYDNTKDNLEDDNFFVVSGPSTGGSYGVFKCLDNKGGLISNTAPSIDETNAGDEYYETADGYVWKYMYKISSAEWNKFTTDDYIPVIIDANVTSNAVAGSLETIIVEDGGERYICYASGTIKESSVSGDPLIYDIYPDDDTILSSSDDYYENSAFYISEGTGVGQIRTISGYIASQNRILINEAFDPIPDTSSKWEISPALSIYGDGIGAVARSVVNKQTKTIGSVEILNKGRNYSYASVVISSNGDNIVTAELSPTISPPGGHGSDVINELYANKVGVSVVFANTEANTITTANDFRKIGIIKDPLFANVELTISGVTATQFTDGETVIQYEPQSTNLLLQTYSYTIGRYQTLKLDLDDISPFANGESETTISSEGKSATVIGYDDAANTALVYLDTGSDAFIDNEYIGNGSKTRSVDTITAAEPPVVTTANAHFIANGSQITFHNLDGTALVEGDVYYAKVIDSTTLSIYTDSGLTTEFDNSANTAASTGYITTGTQVQQILNAEYTHASNNSVISGKDDYGNEFGFNENLPLSLTVTLDGSVISGYTASANSLSITDVTLTENNVVTMKVYSTVESVLNVDYIGRTSAEVSYRAGQTLRLRNVRGNFSTSTQIKGLTSGVIADVDRIDRSFNTFNQLTKCVVTVTYTGTQYDGVAGTGFRIDDFVTQDHGTAGYASGYLHSVSNTVTRTISTISTTDPVVVTTRVPHLFANGQTVSFDNLNGSVLQGDPSYSYVIANTTSTTFEVWNGASGGASIDNTNGGEANTGQVTASGIGSTGINSQRTFYLNNVKGIFASGNEGTANVIIANTHFNGSAASGAKVDVNSRIDGDLVDNSGEIIYIETMRPITRNNDQTEKVRIILEF